ncbi:MAG: hypothetical protein KGZ68_19045 [Dechloromonas sp.]|jgi:hypothetical protein|nr:hypothetical protein [Dechloromonas sp.]
MSQQKNNDIFCGGAACRKSACRAHPGKPARALLPHSKKIIRLPQQSDKWTSQSPTEKRGNLHRMMQRNMRAKVFTTTLREETA